MPGARSSRVTNLTPENLARIAERDDSVVYQPTHDITFNPWSAERVRRCVQLITAIASKCANEDEARGRVRLVGGDVLEFETKYQLMFQRLTEPDIAKNKSHVAIVLSMIELRGEIESGSITDEGAQKLVSERALAGLLAQAQAASSSD